MPNTRYSILAFALLLLLSAPAAAQPWQHDVPQKGPPAAPEPLETPPQRQQAPQPQPAPQPAPQQAPQPAGGYYAAPPQTGQAVGARNATAIDGFGLHFPAFTLKLPTLQLPSTFKLRTGPHMVLDSAKAPYVQHSPMTLSAPVAMQAVPAQGPMPSQAPTPASAPGRPWQKSCQLDEEMLKRERIREQEIAMLKQQVASLASSMETMVRLTERAYGTETGQASPSTQVRHVAPQPFQLSRTRQIAKPQSMYHQTSAQLENTPGISSAQRAAWQSPINARRLPPNPASTLRFLPPVR